MKKILLSLFLLILTNSLFPQGSPKYLEFETSMGSFKMKLYTDLIPVTTNRILELAKQGFYDGIIFHRVVKGFVIQAGDPTGTGEGGSGLTIPDEFYDNLVYDKPGIVGMANAGPNTNDSQFFITVRAAEHLSGKYTIFAKIVEGMDVVYAINSVAVNETDKPLKDVKIIKVNVIE